MRRQRRVVAACAAATLAIAAAGCGSSSGGSGGGSGSSGGSAAAGSPIHVLSIVDMTGPTKAYGTQEMVGMNAAAKYYNARGGIDGHKVDITTMDDQGSASTATSEAVKALSSDPSHYTMVWAGAGGTDLPALIPIMKRFPVYTESIDDGADQCVQASACPHQFSNVGSTAAPEIKDAQWLKQKGFKKVGILEEAFAFTQAETPPLVAELKKLGVPYVTVSFPQSATNVSAQMSQLKSDGADAVFAEVLGPPAGYALSARSTLSWNVPVLFDIAGSSLDITKLAPASETKNAYESAVYCMVPSNHAHGYSTLLQEAGASNVTGLCNLASGGWSAIVMLDNAITHAKSTNYQALTTAMENLTPAEQNNPLYTSATAMRYSASDHENLDYGPQDYTIVPVGPVKDGQIQAP